MKNKILITGAAGFIGFHLSRRLLKEGWDVTGLDNINAYYSVKLKKDRLKVLQTHDNFRFVKVDLEDKAGIENTFFEGQFEYVVNLAAQAGVRHSLENPHVYVSTNVEGFLNILEGCKKFKIKHLIYASSSSVYGANKNMPFSENDNVDHPLALYAATKKCNELMAHSYASLFGIPVTGLRFFSVYGPWGRPDMALYIFAKAIYEGVPIKVYNHGVMSRDFTYVDDIVEGIYRLIPKIAAGNTNWDPTNPDVATSYAPYRLYNIGHGHPVELNTFISLIEKNIGRTAIKEQLPMQPGDISLNQCDVHLLNEAINYSPQTTVEVGVKRFCDWFREYHNYK